MQHCRNKRRRGDGDTTAIPVPFCGINTLPAHFVKFLRAAEAARSLAFYLCFLST